MLDKTRDRLGEGRPPTTRIELILREEQRLARDDINIDPRTILVVEHRRTRSLSTTLLGDTKRLGIEATLELLARRLGEAHRHTRLQNAALPEPLAYAWYWKGWFFA